MKIRELEKGELPIIVSFGILSIILLVLSLKMYMKSPTLSSQGAFPLLLSILMILMSILMLFEIRRLDRSASNGPGFINLLKEVFDFIFPDRTAFIMVLVIAYAIALTKVGFIISTFLFLWTSMVILRRDNLLKTVLISAGIVAFNYVVFQTIFKVILP